MLMCCNAGTTAAEAGRERTPGGSDGGATPYSKTSSASLASPYKDPFIARLLHHATAGVPGAVVAGLSAAPVGSKAAEGAAKQLEGTLK